MLSLSRRARAPTCMLGETIGKVYLHSTVAGDLHAGFDLQPGRGNHGLS